MVWKNDKEKKWNLPKNDFIFVIELILIYESNILFKVWNYVIINPNFDN